MEQVSKKSIFLTGIVKQNPIFVMLLGMCPALAVTSRLSNAIGMALAFFLVIVITNVIISAARKIIPDEVRLPCYIITIAMMVTAVEMIVQAFAFDVAQSLGLFLPLIVVNCIVFGRAEAFASKNKVLDSLVDGVAMAAGFAIAIILIAFCRELLATGGIEIRNPFDNSILIDTKSWFISSDYYQYNNNPIAYLNEHAGNVPDVPGLVLFRERIKIPLFGEAIGAFLTLGFIIAAINARTLKKEKGKKVVAKGGQ